MASSSPSAQDTIRTSSSSSGKCLNFDHITFWVSNARQAASYYCLNFGFEPLAYAGLETGSRSKSCHVVKQGSIILNFMSSIIPDLTEISSHVATHGDSVKDISFTVDNLDVILKRAVEKGATIINGPLELHDTDDHGSFVRMATVSTFGDVTHTFVDRKFYTGLFLPGYQKTPLNGLSSFLKGLPGVNLTHVDHCVGSQNQDEIIKTSDWYEAILSFHRFWSIDDINVQTEFSALKFIVVANDSETIKLNILEPASGLRKSQVTEFNEFNGGPGIQHIALHTDDIIQSEYYNGCY